MSMSILNKTKKFEPVFLYVDNGRIKKWIRDRKEVEKKMNQTIPVVNKLFDQPLTDEEMMIVMGRGSDYVISLFKDKSGFPKADNETIFKLTGKDPRPVITALAEFRKSGHYLIDEFEIKKGRILLKDEAIEKYTEAVTFHTKSNLGNDALRIAQNLCNQLNDALLLGFITQNGNGFTEAAKGLDKLLTERLISRDNTNPYNSKTKIEFVPNYEEIKWIGDERLDV